MSGQWGVDWMSWEQKAVYRILKTKTMTPKNAKKEMDKLRREFVTVVATAREPVEWWQTREMAQKLEDLDTLYNPQKSIK